MASWFRSWHGAPTDTKWLSIARRAETTPATVAAVAWALLDYASQRPNRGSVDGFDVESYSAWAGLDESTVEAVFVAMKQKGIITNGRWASWEKRQPEREDDSAERVKRYRERQAQSVSHSNASVTHSNAPDTDTDTDTDTEGKASSLVKSELAPPLAATPPDPAKTPQKARKQKPAPVEENRPPEIDTLHSIVGVYPPRETWETLAAAASGYTEAQMRQTYAAWRTVTPNKHNWTWVSEWLPYGGKPPSPYSKPNGKMTMPPGCPPPEQLWGMVQREIDRVHSYGKPELPAQVIKAIESVGGWYTVCKCDPEGPTPARLRDAYRSVIHG